jgi:hypothetical protein
MEPAVLTASAAVLGSLTGASASLVTAWLSQRTQGRRAAVQAEVHKREVLYADFITECSKLYLDALEHSLERPEIFQPVYSLASRIRLVASDGVFEETENVLEAIVETYRAPNLTIEKLREMSLAELHDPLRRFAAACRLELESLKVRI